MTAKAHELNVEGNNNSPQQNRPDKKQSGKAAFFSYILLPGIIPQIRELTRGGFGFLALLIANVYQAVRILPANHPYTKFENKGHFSIRQVIAAAANNVKIDKKNIDQIIIFFAVFAGLLILTLQFISFVLLMISGDAWAQANPPGGMFTTANPDTDVSFHMMREVFGIPDLFGTVTPTPFHKGLHVMLNFYNLAILVVAILVFIYYVFVVVGETAQTGTPFGQRFSHIYAPFRLVIAIGLLVPLNHGLNGAQYVTLNAAKIGSSFATSGWIQFNDALANSNPLGAENATLIAETKAPDSRGLVEFMAMAVTCREAYKISPDPKTIKQMCYVPGPNNQEVVKTCGGANSLTTSNSIKMVFGAYNSSETGEFIPYCGSVVVPITVPQAASSKSGDPGDLQKKYLETVTKLWNDQELASMGKGFAKTYSPSDRCSADLICEPDQSKKETIISLYKSEIDKLVKDHYANARSSADLKMQQETKKLGWGGAGIWYNRIAQINGAYVTATMNIPAGEQWPKIMQFVLDSRQKADGTFTGCKAFEPNLADNSAIQFPTGSIGQYYGRTFNAAYQYWTCDKKNVANFFLDSISAIFGLQGLMSIRETTKDSNGNTVQVHPLAKLAALGKGLIDSAVRNMGFAMGTSFLGGMVGVLSPHLGASLDAASGMFVSIATIGLSIGFITYYILPFLPFIYFFFAVGGWVKSIFEAMVGAPLWALAHLRIDGDGLPGKMAMNGYFLIFEIFLRPILTIFGLLGGMAIFTALATMLNQIFDLVVLNTAQVDLSKEVGKFEFSRHIVDVFFFTTVYAVILYMMAVSSFKMINLVPNNILRWLGQSVSSFSDQTQDPTQGLTQYAAIGGATVGGQLAGGVTQLSKAGGGVPGGLFGAIAGRR